MDLIVCVDKNWGIGKNNNLLFHIPEDMTFFKEMTIGKTILMGRKTLESFKNGKPLPNRLNVVLTHSPELYEDSENLKFISNKDIYSYSDSILIGGASLYSLLLDNCENAYITKVNAEKEADAFFPNLDKMDNWKLEKVLKKGNSGGFSYEILKYKNQKKKK